jgi:hypothetical protein
LIANQDGNDPEAKDGAAQPGSRRKNPASLSIPRPALDAGVESAAGAAGRPRTTLQEDRTMRYLCMHKVSPEDEADQPPPPGLVEQMGALIGELVSSGAFVAGEGLRPSALRYRLTRAGERWTVTRGPLVGRNELPTGLAILSVRTSEEALDWAQRYGTALEADELELGPLTEEWDLARQPRPSGAPLRYMVLPKATRETEAGKAPSPRQKAALARLHAEMSAAGVLGFHAALQPSAKAVRALYRRGDRTLIDGPFSESKELVGGFCLMELGSRDEVLAFTDRFVAILGGTREVDIRPVAEA